MAYRVDYGPVPKVPGAGGLGFRLVFLTAACFLLFWILVQTLWPRGGDLLRGMLIPGDREVTVLALETFAAELGQGENLKSAFTHFCTAILEGSGFGSG